MKPVTPALCGGLVDRMPAQGGHDADNDRLSHAIYFANELKDSRLRKTKASWTPTRRKKQSLQIQKVRPWLIATGPKTASGKARFAANANKGKGRDASANRIRRALHAQTLFLRCVKRLLDLRDAGCPRSAALLSHLCLTEGRAVTRILLETLILDGFPAPCNRAQQ